MKTEQQIKNKIKELKESVDFGNKPDSAIILLEAEITLLEWILES